MAFTSFFVAIALAGSAMAGSFPFGPAHNISAPHPLNATTAATTSSSTPVATTSTSTIAFKPFNFTHGFVAAAVTTVPYGAATITTAPIPYTSTINNGGNYGNGNCGNNQQCESYSACSTPCTSTKHCTTSTSCTTPCVSVCSSTNGAIATQAAAGGLGLAMMGAALLL